MFEDAEISKLNDLEMLVFDYIIKNPEDVQKMTIRELAKEVHTSTSAIVRMSVKLGFSGWAELKYYLIGKEKEHLTFVNTYESMISLNLFWNTLSSAVFQKKLARAVEMIHASQYCVFMGLGTSEMLGNYGTRYFNNLGINSFSFGDIFRPVTAHEFQHVLVFVLSVSGETQEVINRVIDLRQADATIISITNNENSTLSKISEMNFSYNMLEELSTTEKSVKLTTQLPVLAILEILAHRASQGLKMGKVED
ncbi:MAG: MurR/RpiR family transcriptional regulator [Streptococcaceae bacterium]|jgi:DNA-binding MurR/RpiR family transcriptional regulator|nr:MurR/RpiR family transcriptional regulator [Streptococcaceae bacterium]